MINKPPRVPKSKEEDQKGAAEGNLRKKKKGRSKPSKAHAVIVELREQRKQNLALPSFHNKVCK